MEALGRPPTQALRPWALGEGTVVKGDGKGLHSSAYQRTYAGGRTVVWREIPDHHVELMFSAKRTGDETSAGDDDGALRVFSGVAGDSISLPVRVKGGC